MKISDVILKDDMPSIHRSIRQVKIFQFLGDPLPFSPDKKWLFEDQIKRQERDCRLKRDKALVKDVLTNEIFSVFVSQIKWKTLGEEVALYVEREVV